MTITNSFNCNNIENSFFKKEEIIAANKFSDLDFLELTPYLDLNIYQSTYRVCKYWKQLAAESTKPRPFVDQPNLLDEHCFKLSIATTKNADEIAELVVVAFSKGDVFRKPGQRRTSREEVEELMQTPNNRWYIVTINKRIVAAMLYITESEKEASINMLSAHPDYWGQKLGLFLNSKAEEVARQQGKTNLNISAASTNGRLIEYYEKQGFQKVSDHKEYFPLDLQEEYLIPEYRGYDSNGKALLRNYDMTKALRPIN